jgi:hypothetical protein
MSNECLYRFVSAQFAHMNLLIGTAARKRRIRLPIDIESGRIVE